MSNQLITRRAIIRRCELHIVDRACQVAAHLYCSASVTRSVALDAMATEFLGGPIWLDPSFRRRGSDHPWDWWYRPRPDQDELIEAALRSIGEELAMADRGDQVVYLCRHFLHVWTLNPMTGPWSD